VVKIIKLRVLPVCFLVNILFQICFLDWIILMTITSFDVANCTKITALFPVNFLSQISVSKYHLSLLLLWNIRTSFHVVLQDLTEYMNTANLHYLQGYILEKSCKQWGHDVQHGLREAKDPQNMIMCKLMFNKNKIIYVGFIATLSLFLAESCQGDWMM
jgi:hypothetical protein